MAAAWETETVAHCERSGVLAVGGWEICEWDKWIAIDLPYLEGNIQVKGLIYGWETEA